jgi:hypothetical protein
MNRKKRKKKYQLAWLKDVLKKSKIKVLYKKRAKRKPVQLAKV